MTIAYSGDLQSLQYANTFLLPCSSQRSHHHICLSHRCTWVPCIESRGDFYTCGSGFFFHGHAGYIHSMRLVTVGGPVFQASINKNQGERIKKLWNPMSVCVWMGNTRLTTVKLYSITRLSYLCSSPKLLQWYTYDLGTKCQDSLSPSRSTGCLYDVVWFSFCGIQSLFYL